MVDGMAASIEKLSARIESLDQNKIIENFQGIKDLLELANSVNTQSGQVQQNVQTSGTAVASRAVARPTGQTIIASPGQRTAGSNPVIYNQAPKRKTQRIVMQFANTHFDGFITTEDA